MVQRRQQARLPLESNSPFFIVEEFFGQDLDRDLSLEPHVLCPVDLSHPPGPERAENLVRAEARSG